MEVGPIFRALINQKSRFLLIALEIALTLAIVTNCLNMILDERAKLLRDIGVDEHNLLVVTSEPFAAAFEEETYVQASYEEDLRKLRALPGIRAATGIHQVPLSGGGSASGRRAVGTEIDTRTTPYFVVGTDALDALGIELVEGRAFLESDFAETAANEEAGADDDRVDHQNVIVTHETANVLFPDGGALGSNIENATGDSVETIVGIVERMHGSWPLSSVAERVTLYPGFPAGSRRARYMVRTEPGMIDEMFTTVETELATLNAGRIVSVETLQEVKAETYSGVTALTQLLLGLSVLLVLVTSLGIVGLTSFSVSQRKKEIGTRRALGATRLAILRYFLVENWVVTGVGLTLGILLTYGLNFALANWFDVSRIGPQLVVAGMGLLWGVGLVAALIPALRGTTVSPVIATRNV
jgi:putative ABC transport system permease protein